MEVVEQVSAQLSGQVAKDPSPIAKGKRTKRYRTHSSIPFTTLPPSNERLASSSADDSTTTEEEDTARCLILLAQGHFPPNKRSTLDHHHRQVTEQRTYFKTINNASTVDKATGGSCMYTCKTCNRAFSSFQALGGHRASHKKPKNERRSAMFSEEEDFPSPSSISSFRNRMSSDTLSLQLSNNFNTNAMPKPSAPSPRIHECSYCGAEFNSGQALGGHMRRHRGAPISPRVNIASAAAASPRNVLSLDLNLPAPEDENQRFGPRQQKSPEEKNEAGENIVLSTTTTAPTLVDCHY